MDGEIIDYPVEDNSAYYNTPEESFTLYARSSQSIDVEKATAVIIDGVCIPI